MYGIGRSIGTHEIDLVKKVFDRQTMRDLHDIFKYRIEYEYQFFDELILAYGKHFGQTTALALINDTHYSIAVVEIEYRDTLPYRLTETLLLGYEHLEQPDVKKEAIAFIVHAYNELNNMYDNDAIDPPFLSFRVLSL